VLQQNSIPGADDSSSDSSDEDEVLRIIRHSDSDTSTSADGSLSSSDEFSSSSDDEAFKLGVVARQALGKIVVDFNSVYEELIS
jgi:hypothetical protein